MEIFDSLQLQLDDINFNIKTNLEEIERKYIKVKEEDVEMNEVEENIEDEMQKRLDMLNISEKDANKEYENDKIIKDLFGEEESEDIDLLDRLNNNLEEENRLIFDIGNKNNLYSAKELEKDDMLKIINKGGLKDIDLEYINKIDKDRQEYPISDEIDEKIISESFNDALEKVKKEIEKTDKKRRIVKKKSCSEDKEINPKTGKCVKKCKPGQVRDIDTFRCKKVK